MKIVIDYRENSLYDSCSAILGLNKLEKDITILKENLDIGDIAIYNDNGGMISLIERKNLNDLAASINDGRYKEQSYRLDKTNIPNHNIIYLIEGNLENYTRRFGRIDKTALYSSIATLQYYKGFSIIRSNNCSESAEYIIRFCNKLRKVGTESMYYTVCKDSSEIKATNNIIRPDTYIDTIKQKKKEFLTSQNIHELWLSQIPNVSVKAARTILIEYKTIWRLKDSLEKDKNCLNLIKLETQNGKTRAIGKNVVDSICGFLTN